MGLRMRIELNVGNLVEFLCLVNWGRAIVYAIIRF